MRKRSYSKERGSFLDVRLQHEAWREDAEAAETKEGDEESDTDGETATEPPSPRLVAALPSAPTGLPRVLQAWQRKGTQSSMP